MLTGGGGAVHKNLTFAERGGAQNGQKKVDIINERPPRNISQNFGYVSNFCLTKTEIKI